MIVGVGIDVVDIARFGDTLRRTPAMLGRLFAPGELDRFGAATVGPADPTDPPAEIPEGTALASLAARFAAKEALAKALGAPPGLVWTDAHVVSEDSGRPCLEIHGSVARRAQALGVTGVHVSLTHDGGIASAVVVAEACDGDRLPAREADEHRTSER